MRYFTSPLRVILLIVLMGGVGGCGDQDPVEPPLPGVVVISLATIQADDGAALISITGPGISGVQSANAANTVTWRLVSGTEVRAVIVGDLVSGPVLTAQVGDVHRVDQYVGAVQEVADRAGEMRTALSGYSITVTSGSGA